MTKFFVILFLCIAGTSASYPDLPQASATKVTLEVSVSALQSLFNSAKGFVDLVFVSFAELKEFFIRFFDSSDPLNIVATEWQSILKQQAGLIACLTLGVLFITMVIFGGAIMCLCRCCCNKCGGNLEQSKKRSRSKWRCGFTLALLGCSMLIISPGVIVLFTNQWINTVVHDLPDKTSETVQNVFNFLDIIPTQVKIFESEFDKLANETVSRIREMPEDIGEELKQKITKLQSPFTTKLSLYLSNVVELHYFLIIYENQRHSYEMIKEDFKRSLVFYRSNYLPQLAHATCLTDDECNDVFIEISNLKFHDNQTHQNRSSDKSFLDAYNSTCMVALSEIIPENKKNVDNYVNSTFDDATISDAESGALETLNSIRVQFNISRDIEEKLSSIRKTLVEYQDKIDKFLKIYSDNYDIYRWYAGLALGILIILLPSLYIFGMFFGQFCNSGSTSPTERGALSNFGGILLMAAVGLFFLFSWILMIVVTITFIFGGAVERYGCETAQSPYELLKFLDENVLDNLTLPGVDLLETTKLKSYSIITSCAQNKGILETFELSGLFNETEIKEALKDFYPEIDYINPPNNLIFSGVVNCLEQLNSSLNFSETTKADIFLNDYTTIISTITTLIPRVPTAYKAIVADAADDLIKLHPDLINLTSLLESLETTKNKINSLLPLIQQLLIELPQTLTDVNQQMQDITPTLVNETVTAFAGSLIADMTGYADWFIYQTSYNFAKCGPIYTAYNGVVDIVCGYFVTAVNGFWFALGWSLFFMVPAFILALKLAKFYRRMEETDPDLPKPTSIEIHPIRNTNNSRTGRARSSKIDDPKPKRFIPKRPNNKVRPADF